MEDLFQHDWRKENIQRWQMYLEKGMYRFIWKYGYLRFFLLVYPINLFSGYYINGQNPDYWTNSWVLLVCLLLGSYFYGWQLWHGTNKSYLAHKSKNGGERRE